MSLGKLKAKFQDGLTQLLSGSPQQVQQQQPVPYAPPVVLQAAQQLQQPQSQQHVPPPLHIIRCTCHSVSPIPDPSHGTFVHPGTLMGPGELSLLRERIAGTAPAPPPFAAAVESLKADTPAQYTPHALKDVLVEWYDGPKMGHKELVEEDGKMVYMQAVMWVITNDERYARNAAVIILAWSTTNQTLTGRNAPLEAGWSMASFARAAELLKCTWPGWAAAGVEGPFLAWVNRLMLPALNNEMLQRLPLANWQTTVAEAKGALAIFTGNRDLWEDALALWLQVASVYLHVCGECGETSRDLYHSQFGLGGLIQLAEMAWHQGTDLYSWCNSRLFTCMEFHAFITLGGQPPEWCYPLKGIGFLPTGWEIGYNHYCGRMGWQMPQTEALLAKNRPEKYVFHWGLGSLTHANTAAALRQQQQQVAVS